MTDASPGLRTVAGLALVVVRGRSMEPTLRDGDRLLVRAVTGGAADGAAPGRLVVVRLPGGRPLAVKRLLRSGPDGWWVERDNPREGVDSWQVGAVAGDDRLAVVLARLHPLPRRFAGGGHAGTGHPG